MYRLIFLLDLVDDCLGNLKLDSHFFCKNLTNELFVLKIAMLNTLLYHYGHFSLDLA